MKTRLLMNLLGLLLIIMLPLPTSSSTSRIMCTWETPNGWIDLRPLANTDNTPRFVEVEDSRGLFIYYWNPCYQFNLHACQNTSVCQYDIKKDVYYIIGREGTTGYHTIDGLSVIQYTADTDIYRTVDVVLICDGNIEGNLYFIKEHPITHYIFELRSKYACPFHEILTPPTVLSEAKISVGHTSIIALPQPLPKYYYLENITIFLLFIVITLAVLSITFVTGLCMIMYRTLWNTGTSKSAPGTLECLSYQDITESDFINPCLEVPYIAECKKEYLTETVENCSELEFTESVDKSCS